MKRVVSGLFLGVLVVTAVGCSQQSSGKGTMSGSPPPTDAEGQLVYAVKANDVKTVSGFVGADPQLVSAVREGGETLLHIAAEFDAVDVASYLLDQGADVNAVDVGGQTAMTIMEKRRMRNTKTYELLESRGGEVF